MLADMEYIETTLDQAASARAAAGDPTEDQRARARGAAQKFVAGFPVHDEEAERKMLDDMIARRRQALEKFREDRAQVRALLGDRGITPLAVCPAGAWERICLQAGLLLLRPDPQSRVYVSPSIFDGFQGERDPRTGAATSSGAVMDQYYAVNPGELVRRAFPDGREPGFGDERLRATLRMPAPPADVAAVLLRASGLELCVAAEAGAIGFAEKPSELHNRRHQDHVIQGVVTSFGGSLGDRDRWARERGYESYQDWYEKCPIVYHEHGSAAAVLAQFGPFPIEREVVDRVVASDDVIGEQPSPLEAITWDPREEALTINFDGSEHAYDWREIEVRVERNRAQVIGGSSEGSGGSGVGMDRSGPTTDV